MYLYLQEQRLVLVVAEAQPKLAQNCAQVVWLHFLVVNKHLVELLDLDRAELLVQTRRFSGVADRRCGTGHVEYGYFWLAQEKCRPQMMCCVGVYRKYEMFDICNDRQHALKW